ACGAPSYRMAPRPEAPADPDRDAPASSLLCGTSMPRSGKALVVQKYGGTSVGDIERIRNVARRALAAKKAGNDVVVVVSAMAGETNRLLKLTSALAKRPSQREQDVVVS